MFPFTRACALCGLLLLIGGIQSAPPAIMGSAARELRIPATLQTSEGREFMKYAVSCALPEGINARVPAASQGEAEEVFEGSMGLAPAWSDRAMHPQEERRVSACMLARSNFYGVAVLLSLRRPDAPVGSSLHADANERMRFSRLEGKFFGNLFAPGQPAYFCSGDDQPDRSRWLRSFHRICAIGESPSGLSRCGFIDVGVCSTGSARQAGVNYEDSEIAVYLPAAQSRFQSFP